MERRRRPQHQHLGNEGECSGSTQGIEGQAVKYGVKSGPSSVSNKRVVGSEESVEDLGESFWNFLCFLPHALRFLPSPM